MQTTATAGASTTTAHHASDDVAQHNSHSHRAAHMRSDLPVMKLAGTLLEEIIHLRAWLSCPHSRKMPPHLARHASRGSRMHIARRRTGTVAQREERGKAVQADALPCVTRACSAPTTERAGGPCSVRRLSCLPAIRCRAFSTSPAKAGQAGAATLRWAAQQMGKALVTQRKGTVPSAHLPARRPPRQAPHL